MPITSAITMAIEASWIVTGSFCRMRSSTGYVNPHRLRRDCRRARPAPSRRIAPGSADRGDTAARICSITAGSRSSPAMIRAGSPGKQLLQREDDHRHEEQGRDQLQQSFAEKIQHGRVRFRRSYHGDGSFERQSDHTHEAVGHLLVAVELVCVSDKNAAVIEIDLRGRPARIVFVSFS